MNRGSIGDRLACQVLLIGSWLGWSPESLEALCQRLASKPNEYYEFWPKYSFLLLIVGIPYCVVAFLRLLVRLPLLSQESWGAVASAMR